MGESREFARIIDGELCLKATPLREVLGISPQTLSEWVGKGMPRVQYGWYPLKRVLEWRGFTQGDRKDAAIDLQRRKLEVEIALKESQQELTKLKTDITNGKYIEREVITEEYRRFFVILKREMLSIPRRVAGIISAYIDPLEVRRLEKEMKDSVNKALMAFVQSGVLSDE